MGLLWGWDELVEVTGSSIPMRTPTAWGSSPCALPSRPHRNPRNLRGSLSYFRNWYLQIHWHAALTFPLQTSPLSLNTGSCVKRRRNYLSSQWWIMLWRETITCVLHGPHAVTLHHFHFLWHLQQTANPIVDKGIVIPSEGWTQELFATHNCTVRHWRASRLALDFSKVVLGTGRRWWGNLATFPGPGSWYAQWPFLSGPWPFFLLPAWIAEAVPPATTRPVLFGFCSAASDHLWHQPPRQREAGGEEQISDTHFGSEAKAVFPMLAALQNTEQTVLNTKRGRQGGVGFWVSALNSVLQSHIRSHSNVLECSKAWLGAQGQTWLHGYQNLIFKRVYFQFSFHLLIPQRL